MKYFIAENGQQAGPFEPNELLAHGLTVNSLVWCEGMPTWVSASQVPELMAVLNGQTFNPGGMDTQLPQTPPMGDAQLPQMPPYGGQPQQPTTYGQGNQPYAFLDHRYHRHLPCQWCEVQVQPRRLCRSQQEVGIGQDVDADYLRCRYRSRSLQCIYDYDQPRTAATDPGRRHRLPLRLLSSEQLTDNS